MIPYKEGVGGSSPSAPTKSTVTACFVSFKCTGRDRNPEVFYGMPVTLTGMLLFCVGRVAEPPEIVCAPAFDGLAGDERTRMDAAGVDGDSATLNSRHGKTHGAAWGGGV